MRDVAEQIEQHASDGPPDKPTQSTLENTFRTHCRQGGPDAQTGTEKSEQHAARDDLADEREQVRIGRRYVRAAEPDVEIMPDLTAERTENDAADQPDQDASHQFARVAFDHTVYPTEQQGDQPVYREGQDKGRPGGRRLYDSTGPIDFLNIAVVRDEGFGDQSPHQPSGPSGNQSEQNARSHRHLRAALRLEAEACVADIDLIAGSKRLRRLPRDTHSIDVGAVGGAVVDQDRLPVRHL